MSLQWYAQRSKNAAERFEAEFAEAVAAIEANPERYPVCVDDRHRFYLLKRYPFQLIYRKTDTGQWLIVAVAHTSRKAAGAATTPTPIPPTVDHGVPGVGPCVAAGMTWGFARRKLLVCNNFVNCDGYAKLARHGWHDMVVGTA